MELTPRAMSEAIASQQICSWIPTRRRTTNGSAVATVSFSTSRTTVFSSGARGGGMGTMSRGI